MTGKVLMWPSFSGGWSIELPNGDTNLNISTSTTQGFMEALNYAITNQFNFLCDGAPAGIANRSQITCNSALSIPPLNDIKVEIDADIGFNPTVLGDGITFDSMQNCRLDMQGYINYGGNGSVMKFKPINSVYSGGIGINKSRIRIADNIIYQSTGATPFANIYMDVTSANSVIVANDIDIRELKAEGATQNSLAPYNMYVTGSTASGAVFRLNNIKLGAMLGANVACLYITNFPFSGDNIYEITSMNPISLNSLSPTAVGVYTNNSNDTFILGSVYPGEGAYAYGFQFGPLSTQNCVMGGRAAGAALGYLLDQNTAGGNRWFGQGISYNMGAAGVSSLNSLTGALSITSTGGSINVTPSGTTVNLDTTGSGSGTGLYTKLDTQTASNSAALTFSTGINSSNLYYQLNINDLVVATSGTNLQFVIGSTGGLASPYSYEGETDHTGSAISAYSSSSASSIILAQNLGNATTEYVNGWIKFTNPTTTAGPQMIQWDLTFRDTSGRMCNSYGSGDYIGSGIVMNQLQISASSGNLTSGSIELIGNT